MQRRPVVPTNPTCIFLLLTPVVDSLLLTQSLAEQIAAHAKLENAEWRLLYRATRDGANAESFHRLCDGKGPRTLTVARVASSGMLVGGFTRVVWKSPERGSKSVPDASAFIFNNRADGGATIAKFAVREEQGRMAVYHQANYGPYFGGYDLALLRRGGLDHSHRDNAYYATGHHAGVGAQKFTVDEIEVDERFTKRF